MDLSNWKLSGASIEHLISLTISQNVQADCTLSAAYRVPSSGLVDLPKLGDTVEFTCTLLDYIDTFSELRYVDVTMIPRTIPMIKAIVNSVSVSLNTYSITAKTDFNKFVKSGKIKELDFMNMEERKALFDITGTPSDEQYRDFFESACKFKGSLYYAPSIQSSTIVRTSLANIIEDPESEDVIPIRFIKAESAFSMSRESESNDATPNVYDIVLNVKFPRINTLVKAITLGSDDSPPSGLRAQVQIPIGDGEDTYTAFGVYDRPPKKSLILQALASSGWNYESSTILATYKTDNIYDVGGSTIIHQADASDDLLTLSLKATRTFNQNVSLPIVVRISNPSAIAKAGKVNYKRVDKSFTYTYGGGFTPTTNFSTYTDIMGTAHLDEMAAFILKARYEMQSTGLSLLIGSYTENAILSYRLREVGDEEHFTILTSGPLPFKYTSTYGEDVVIVGRTYTFDVQNASASLTLQAKFIKNSSDIVIDPEAPAIVIPPPVFIPSNSSPHNNVGGGLLSVNGPESWQQDDNRWDFENTVTLKHYYSYYTAPTLLQEKPNPELTVTNYYVHDVYKNDKYTAVPNGLTNEQCRIKYDKQKPVYTLAITLPQITYTDIII